MYHPDGRLEIVKSTEAPERIAPEFEENDAAAG
jgi:hypothetical protein